ncbi:MAG: EamA family transporter [Candidatus Micrarchaeaceae archaeon]
MKLKHRYVGFLVISTLLGATGQLLFKAAFDKSGSLVAFLLAGLLAYIFSTIFYFYVLSRTHLSWAYGIGGMSYIFAVIMARLILLENIPLLRWIGVLVITAGVVLVEFS